LEGIPARVLEMVEEMAGEHQGEFLYCVITEKAVIVEEPMDYILDTNMEIFLASSGEIVFCVVKRC
jgi:hypothetical protein